MVLIVAIMMSVGCATVTLTEQGTRKISSSPTYQKRQQFFFWGLAGEHSIDVKEVCGGRDAKQMQTQNTFVDGLLRVITLGIYAPRTAKIWCAPGANT